MAGENSSIIRIIHSIRPLLSYTGTSDHLSGFLLRLSLPKFYIADDAAGKSHNAMARGFFSALSNYISVTHRPRTGRTIMMCACVCCLPDVELLTGVTKSGWHHLRRD